jgi:hypothetical protein
MVTLVIARQFFITHVQNSLKDVSAAESTWDETQGMKSSYKILIRKFEGKSPQGMYMHCRRLRLKWNPLNTGYECGPDYVTIMWMQLWIIGFHKRKRISSLLKQLLTFKGLYTVELLKLMVLFWFFFVKFISDGKIHLKLIGSMYRTHNKDN